MSSTSNNEAAFLAVAIFFALGMWLGNSMGKIDTTKRVAEILSCSDFSSSDLNKLGFSDSESCIRLQWALYEKIGDDCERSINASADAYENLYKDCIYHGAEQEIYLPMLAAYTKLQ